MGTFSPLRQAVWLLRLGFGVMFLYSGYDLYFHPTGWIWAVPLWIRPLIISIVPLLIFIKIQGVFEFISGLVYLFPWSPKNVLTIFASITTLEMFLIIVAYGVDAQTFRDIGLLGGALALLVLIRQK